MVGAQSFLNIHGSIQADHNHSFHRASRAAIRQAIASASDDTPSSGADIL